MIKILFKGLLSCPVFACDICNDMIADLAEGAAMFADVPVRKENMKVDVLHVHKGKCFELAEKQILGKQIAKKIEWQPLGGHLYFLCTNIEVDSKQLEKLKGLHGPRKV